jgi:hypothetical protein
MINRLLYGGVLGAALVTLSTAAYAGGDGDVLDDLLGDVGGFLTGLLGFLV